MEDNYDKMFEDYMSYEWEKQQLLSVTNQSLINEIKNFVSEDGEPLEDYVGEAITTWQTISNQFERTGKITDTQRQWLEDCHIYLFAR